MYIRVKKVKGKEYAYLVQSRWRKRNKNGIIGPRQKVTGYLGRVYRFSDPFPIDFSEFFSVGDIEEYVKGSSREKIIKDLIEWEKAKHNINKKDFFIDLNEKKIAKGDRDAVLAINEGYLCGFTIKKLVSFRSSDKGEPGVGLAKAFVDAGIKIPKEIFIGYFEKV